MQKDLGHGMTNLLSSSRAVVDKHKGGEDIGGQADDGDEVGRDPGRYSGHQPLPVALHQGLEQRASSAAVPAGKDRQRVKVTNFNSDFNHLPVF